jgi:hypothetical protein
MIDNIEEFVQIDKRIDAAEERVADDTRESLRDRWEFGRKMLAQRKGKQLPKGMLAELVEATGGKSQRELSYRMQFAEAYPTEEKVCNALQTFTSWFQVTQSLPKPGKPHGKPSAPKRHKKHAEVVELEKQGSSQQEIAEKTGVGKRQVRHIVEREHIEQEAKDEAVVIDWETLPGPVAKKAETMRRQVRREFEAGFEPRVQAEVQERLEVEIKFMKRMQTESRRVLESRKGIITRDDYDLIRSCLHPDSRESASDEKLAEAFRIFNEAEILFLNEKDCPTTRLPSLEDLLKRRNPA